MAKKHIKTISNFAQNGVKSTKNEKPGNWNTYCVPLGFGNCL